MSIWTKPNINIKTHKSPLLIAKEGDLELKRLRQMKHNQSSRKNNIKVPKAK